ncbi:MAG: hypothetical protein GC202_14270 [Alphaproteobacteria bacterium]|nr:hypothetical protein [Alphaproteobacteria bacterium]
MGRKDPRRPVPIDEESAAQFARLGVAVPEELIDRQVDVFEVWDINRRSVELFLALATQWRTAVLGGGLEPSRLVFLGLDYAAADTLLPVRRSARRRRLLDDLRVMEAAALEAFGETAGAA